MGHKYGGSLYESESKARRACVADWLTAGGRNKSRPPEPVADLVAEASDCGWEWVGGPPPDADELALAIEACWPTPPAAAPAAKKIRRSRRTLVAEQFCCDIGNVREYQPSCRGREARVQIYHVGSLVVCALPTDSAGSVARALEGREWYARPHWRDAEITIYTEVQR